MQTQVYHDRIGYLPWAEPVEFSGGSLTPLEEYQEVAEWVEKHKHTDGFIYPPLTHSVHIPTERFGKDEVDEADLEQIPNSERFALLHKIPASHDLSIQTPVHAHSPREGDAAFIMHLAAYLFGVRLQFYNWWFDGRVPIQSTHSIYVRPSAANSFISTAYATWKGLSTEHQKLITNLLFVNSRTPVYEWKWEQFTVNYMVFDGCYKLAKEVHSLPHTNHGDRLIAVCNFFGIPADKTHFHEIVRLRNALFHETLWDNEQPCSAGSSVSWYEAANLRRLNQRIIAALLGYSGNYINSNWWTLGICNF